MQETRQYRFLKDGDVRESLYAWWWNLQNLQKKRGDRARLRRAKRPDDLLLTEPFYHFLQVMPSAWSEPKELITSAIIAAMLAHVEETRNGLTFAAQLATPKAIGSDRPLVSETRFQVLQKSKNPEEFFVRLVRVIQLAERKVNVISLAESILHWMKEYREGLDREPEDRLAVKWATDYYLQLSNTERKG